MFKPCVEAAEELQAAEIYLNEATPELVDRAICRYNAADERLKWLLREAKLAMGIKVDWEKIKEKRLEKMANELEEKKLEEMGE